MKTWIVTSGVTYLPDNGASALATVLDEERPHVSRLVILDAPAKEILAHAARAACAGFPRLAAALLRNLRDDREGAREAVCAAAGVPTMRAASMNDPDVVQRARDEGVDVIVNLRTRCIYRAPILAAPRIACLNVHHGLLPRHRGLMCDLRALARGEPAGFSIHLMNARIDDGPILHVEETGAGERDYLAFLARTGPLEGRAIARVLREIATRGALPETRPNRCADPVVERGLKLPDVLALHAAGMRL